MSSSGFRSTPPRPYTIPGAAWPSDPDAEPTARAAGGAAPDDVPTDSERADAAAPEVAPRGGGHPVPHPHFRAMTEAECTALLGRHDVGRLAYAHLGHVNIVPIHYAYADGWLYGRTGPGSKLAALRHHPWVAFEVDEVDDVFEWRSVVVRGALYLIARDGPAAERARWDRAVELLRHVVPGTMTPEDPTPERATVFRIHLGEVTGRMARTR